jgi:hypothetical protein
VAVKYRICLLLVVVVGIACGGSPPASHPDEDAVVKTAIEWLELVDTGDYGAGWERAATVLRGAVSKGRFVASLAPVRDPLGSVVSRKLKSTHFATELPGVPDGEYLVIQFDTEFANKRSSVETVTPMLDTDGSWRVSGYYIR